MEIKLELIDVNRKVKLGKNNYEQELKEMTATGTDFVALATQAMTYEEGDKIRITTSEPQQFLVLKLDDTLNESLVYLDGTEWEYLISFDDNVTRARRDHTFRSKSHYLHVRIAQDFEVNAYRNLSQNPYDQAHNTKLYPHATANVETRNDQTFFAKNVIDDVYANLSHGSYPYQSWGINRQDDAELTIDFGRQVSINQVMVTLRADFPHDSYWNNFTLRFDDETTKSFSLAKTEQPQAFSFDSVHTQKVVFTQLIKNTTDDSPFPALTQLDFFGTEIK